MSTGSGTIESWTPYLERAPFDSHGLSVDEGFGRLSASCIHDPPKGLPRNPHAIGCVLLRKALEVGQA
jgi:hypothetical protein